MTTLALGYTGARQQFTVPAGVTSIGVNAYGAPAVTTDNTVPSASWGGRVFGNLAVVPGDVIYVDVGALGSPSYGPSSSVYGGGGAGGWSHHSPAGGWGGTSGGGAVFIYRNGVAFGNVVCVAGGAGGCSHTAGGTNIYGGPGGGSTGGAGYGLAGNGGGGGTPSAGGAAGSGGVAGAFYGGGAGAPGDASNRGGGGGGGGYFGGGGGGINASGGGGSNYIGGLSSATSQQGVNSSPYAVAYFIWNAAPTATADSPAGGTVINTTAVNRFNWTFADSDSGSYQTGYTIYYRIVGAGSWTTVSQTTGNQYYDMPANTLAVGNYEWCIGVVDDQSVGGPTSALSNFSVITPPTAPVVTSPAANATLAVKTNTVTWTVTTQTSYQLQRVADNAGAADPATVYFDTGEVVSSGARSLAVDFPVNSRSEHILLRVTSSGLWSDWTDVKVNVAYTTVRTPTITSVTADNANMNATLVIANPTPSGTQPAVTGNDVYVKLADGTSYRVATGVANNGTFVWQGPGSGVSYRLYVVAVGANGTTAQSADSSAFSVTLARGVMLMDPQNATASRYVFIYNDHGADEVYSIEAVSTSYAGRGLPVVDFGDGTEQTLTIGIKMLETDGDLAAIRSLVMARRVLLYRDIKGRKAYGFISSLPISDYRGMEVTSVVFNVVGNAEVV